jgi:septin family protein
MYRWGLAEVENPAHCDFIHLRSLLIKYGSLFIALLLTADNNIIILLIIRTNLHDLVETSAIVHYHNYRMSKLYKPGRHESILKSDDQYESQVDMKRKNFYEEMSKRENEMRQKIYQKIKEKEQSLREAEEAVSVNVNPLLLLLLFILLY